MKNDELLHKWINQSISEKELKLFQQRPEYEDLKELYFQTDHLKTPGFDSETMLSNILSQKTEIHTNERKTKIISFRSYIKYAVAACLVIVTGLFLWPSNEMTTFEVAQGDSRIELLPDESMVTINAQSKISFNQAEWKKERRVILEGEALFEVKKGSKFTVETYQGEIEVLGTKFNVRDRAGILEVSCQEGKVKVISNKGSQEHILNAGNFVQITKGELSVRSETDAERLLSWTTGMSKFKNTTLKEVLDEIERQYSIRINRKNVNQSEKISCNFTYDDIDLAMKSATAPLGLKYEINDGEIIIFQ